MAEKSQVVSISIEPEILARLDGWVAARGFPSRSNGIQHLVRAELDALAVSDGNGPAVATVTYVYYRHHRDLLERLARVQHEHAEEVVASTHVHLDRERCLEVLILRGPARRVRALGERIVATRGVERGEVIVTSAGAGPRDGAKKKRRK
jgi:CopG family nickel-responsive transcriptional regulator